MAPKLLVFAFLAVAACGQTVIRLPGPRPGDKIAPDPPPAPPPPPRAEQAIAPLKLEWPAWLSIPGANLSAQRANPPGKIVTTSFTACPGDVVHKPSQGCLEKVFDTIEKLDDVYDYFDSLLVEHGFVAEEDSGKTLGETFASLKVREYPEPQDEDYYRQVQFFLRELSTTGRTKIEITFQVKCQPH